MARAAGWKAVRLDDVEAVPWRGTELTWRPLRHALGARIAGIAAYTAERRGQEIVEAHTERDSGRGHEELYVVLRGRATFTLDGEALDAPAGTLVLVEPQVHRHAAAREPRTAVLAFGGPASFEPSASEWIERARPHIRTDPERARRIVDELRAERPDSAGIPIAEALLALGRDDRDAAAALLAELVGGRPELAEPLAADPDLGSLVGRGP
jgi:mannose-6-phosphate isomerase-like protein (cupin superfamily)